jgi:hypothetical protein
MNFKSELNSLLETFNFKPIKEDKNKEIKKIKR